MKNKIEVATYYFPNYHSDKFNEEVHHKNWTEWELVKSAIPRFEGHQQPKIPLWGYEDESNYKVMEKKIFYAKKYGIDCFIFDAYYYKQGKFLNRCLDEGFLKAENKNDIKFALMWANHTWTDIHPAKLNKTPKVVFSGKIDKEIFYNATQDMIDNYFVLDNYWKVDGKPYISLYEINQLIASFDSIEDFKNAIKNFRDRARLKVGEIHINVIAGEIAFLPQEMTSNDSFNIINKLDFDSVTSYTWVHHGKFTGFPTTEYAEFRDKYFKDLSKISALYNKPYYPNITMGWDASPRTLSTEGFENQHYPYTPILINNTPEEFKNAIKKAYDFLDKKNYSTKFYTINAWNEWTEGSYLEPDNINGYKYLEVIKDFKNKL